MGDKQGRGGKGWDRVKPRQGESGIKHTDKSTHDTQKGEGRLPCAGAVHIMARNFASEKFKCRGRRQDNLLISQDIAKHNRNCYCQPFEED